MRSIRKYIILILLIIVIIALMPISKATEEEEESGESTPATSETQDEPQQTPQINEETEQKQEEQSQQQPTQQKTNASGNTNNNKKQTTSTQKSTIATLSNLGIKPNDFTGFKPNVYTYDVEVKNEVDSIEIYANKGQNAQIIEGIGKKKLEEGANKFEIVVTAEDGTTKSTYTINITREIIETDESKKENETLTNKIKEENKMIETTPIENNEQENQNKAKYVIIAASLGTILILTIIFTVTKNKGKFEENDERYEFDEDYDGDVNRTNHFEENYSYYEDDGIRTNVDSKTNDDFLEDIKNKKHSKGKRYI